MPLVNGVEILEMARRDGYAAGGFDIFDVESVRAIIGAAEAENKPVFLQACVRSVEFLGAERAGLIMRHAAENASVPVAVHFDHGAEITCLSDVRNVLDAGFTSIMVDGSRLPLEENIELTRKVVSMAREKGATVEGEVGEIGRVTGGQADEVAKKMAEADGIQDLLTSPADAVRMVTESGLDYVAVSVGSISGTSSRLDLPLIAELASLLPVPLVLHGGTGVPVDDLREAIKLGIAKVNIAHGVRRAFIKASREALQDGKNTDDPYALFDCGRAAMQNYVRMKIRELSGTA